MSRSRDQPRWIGKVTVDASDFPHLLLDAASLVARGATRSPHLKHHHHDFQIDLWRAGDAVFYGEYYLAEDEALDTKAGRDAFGELLLGAPAHRTTSLGVLHVSSGALALVFAHRPRVALTMKDVVAAARARTVRLRPLAEVDGSVGLVPLAPGDYEVVLEHLGTKRAPAESDWGELETRTVIRRR